jgi:hypothetical protein
LSKHLVREAARVRLAIAIEGISDMAGAAQRRRS